MPWDVFVMRFPEGFDGNFDHLPKDWEPEELFTQDYFENEIKKIFPNINGETLNAETFSIELLCRKFDLQAFDTTESKVIDFNQETNEGFTQWREYKDCVLKKLS